MDCQIRAVEGEGNERTFVLSFSSEAPYTRWFGQEILDHTGECADLTRLNSIGVVLYNHKRDKVIGKINKAFASVSLYSAGVNMMSGLVSGINAMRGAVMAAASSIAASAAAAVNSALKIHSPSRVMIESGQFVGEGLARGMTATAGIVQKAASQSMAQPVLDSSNEVRKIEAPATVQSRSSVIGETIGTLTGDRQQGKSKQDEQPMTFVFSPTYHFEGETPSKEDIVEANRMSQAEFEKLMKEWMKKHKRTSFA